MNTPATHLLIDAGNTRIKFALADRSVQGYRYLGYCPTQASAAEITTFLQTVLDSAGILNEVNTFCTLYAHGVCVAGDAVQHAIAQALRALPLGQPTNWLSGATLLAGLRNCYTAPATLGADRWLAAYGVSQQLASQPKPGAAVLATFGTATTIDVLTWDVADHTHVFVGGIIIAGLNTALRSVSTSTAQLPDMQAALTQLHVSNVISIPNATHDALLLGAILAQVGAVRSVLDLTAQRYGAAQCFIAGGAASIMQPYLVQSAHAFALSHIQALEYPVFMGLASVTSNQSNILKHPSNISD